MRCVPLRWRLLCIGVWLGLVTAYGQTYHFVPFSVQEGLPQSQLLRSFQDSRRYLWFATKEAGISRFDGGQFTNYTKADGLHSNYVRDFAEDSLGNLWFATEEGIGWFDGKRFHSLPDSIGPTNFWVNRILFDEDGALWIGTQQYGLLRYFKGSLSFIKIPQYYSEKEEIFDLAIWKGRLAVGTTRGVYLSGTEGFDTPGKWIYRPAMPSNPFCLSMAETPDGTGLWVGTRIGLFQWKDDQLTTIVSPLESPLEVKSLHQDADGTLWVGTDRDGLFEYREGEWYQYNKDHGLGVNEINHINRDHGGNYWLISEVGLVRLTGPEFMHWGPEQGLPDPLVWSIYAESDESVWIGHRNGLSRWDGQKIISYGPEVGMVSGHPSHIITDEFGTLWLACTSGIYYFHQGRFHKLPKTEHWQNERCMVLEAPGNGKLYMGGRTSLETIDLSQGRKYPRELLQLLSPGTLNMINSIYLDAQNTLWLATEGNGLAARLPSGGIRFFRSSQGLPSDVINQLLEGPDGYLWAATGNGLCQLDIASGEPKLRKHIAMEDGLLSFNVYSMAWQDSILWLGTDQGINKLYWTQDTVLNISPYSKSEGFRGIEANHRTVSITPEGSVWWGTVEGVTRYQATPSRNPQAPPKLYLENIELFYDPILDEESEDWFGLPAGLVLSPRENTLTFSYRAVALRGHSRLKYRYRLLGQDLEWSPATDRQQVRYTNLPPGTYQFEVQASTMPNRWATKPAEYAFVITPYLWQRPWFIILVVLGSAGLIIGSVRQRIRTLQVTRRVLTEKVKERTTEIEAQKQEIESQRDQIEKQRDELADKSAFLERALGELERHSIHVTSSIQYAKRIQDAILPRPAAIRQAFPQHFVYLKPKDIVSGDFYWFGSQGQAHIMVVVDCTGHGVPGAIMSMVGHSLLNQTILEKGITDPATILKMLHAGIRMALKQDHENDMNHDGMDVAVLTMYPEDNSCLYAGAKRPLFRVRHGELDVFAGDRFSVGGFQIGRPLPFRNHVPDLEPGDMLYLTTDGYADQFGAKSNRKFMVPRLKSLLTEISGLPVTEQRDILLQRQEDWKGDTEQTDDMLILGIRIPTL